MVYRRLSKPIIPGRDHKDPVECNISGTQFSMKVMPSSSGFDNRSGDVKQLDLSDLAQFRGPQDDTERQFPRKARLFGRSPYAFAGFLDSKLLGTTGMGGSVYTFPTMPATISLFHPPYLEQALINFIYHHYGPGNLRLRKGYYQCARHWRTVKIGGNNWIFLDAFETQFSLDDQGSSSETAPSKIYSYWHPISHSKVLRIHMVNSGWHPYGPCVEYFDEIQKECMQTVSLSLSESALADREEARARFGNVGYSKELAIPDWEFPLVTVDHMGRATIEIPGSPVPEWDE